MEQTRRRETLASAPKLRNAALTAKELRLFQWLLVGAVVASVAVALSLALSSWSARGQPGAARLLPGLASKGGDAKFHKIPISQQI